MKITGYSLIGIGFVLGALAAVLDIESVNWGLFAAGVFLGIAGVITVRVHEHLHKSCEHKVTGHLSDIETSIAAIVSNINMLCDKKDQLDTFRVHQMIDELFKEDIINFTEARRAIGQAYGLQEYAETMSLFASAERAINRAWSASTDGYVNEVKISLQKARKNFGKVQEMIMFLRQDQQSRKQ